MADAPPSAEAPDAGHGQRLMLDVREVRDRVRLRMLASLPALAGGAWLLWSSEGVLLTVLALAGLVFATVWVLLARRSVAQLAGSNDHYLDIGESSLTIRAGSVERSLAWSEIRAVEIDEDRLVVQLRLHPEGSVAVEPQYGALGLRELAETLETARKLAVDGTAPGVRSPQS